MADLSTVPTSLSPNRLSSNSPRSPSRISSASHQPRERPAFRRFASDSSAASLSSTSTCSSLASQASSTLRTSTSSPTDTVNASSPKAASPTASTLPRSTRPGGRPATRTSFVGSASEFLRTAPAQAPVPERLKNSVLITWDQSPFHHRTIGSTSRPVHSNHSSYQGNQPGGSRQYRPPMSPGSPPGSSMSSSPSSCYFSSANSGSQCWTPYGQETIPIAGARSDRIEKEQARRNYDSKVYSAWTGPSAGSDEGVSTGMGSQAWGDMGLNLDSLEELMSGGPKGRLRSKSR